MKYKLIINNEHFGTTVKCVGTNFSGTFMTLFVSCKHVIKTERQYVLEM